MKLSTKTLDIAAIVLIAIAITAIAILSMGEQAAEANTTVLKFDVAENATRFVFDEAPVFNDGLPAYGNAFVTGGYIYEQGTLNGGNGVLPGGPPSGQR